MEGSDKRSAVQDEFFCPRRNGILLPKKIFWHPLPFHLSPGTLLEKTTSFLVLAIFFQFRYKEILRQLTNKSHFLEPPWKLDLQLHSTFWNSSNLVILKGNRHWWVSANWCREVEKRKILQNLFFYFQYAVLNLQVTSNQPISAT